ncbi:hypothetical protein ACTXT7_012786 [Hymenolepis weldensis]
MKSAYTRPSQNCPAITSTAAANTASVAANTTTITTTKTATITMTTITSISTTTVTTNNAVTTTTVLSSCASLSNYRFAPILPIRISKNNAQSPVIPKGATPEVASQSPIIRISMQVPAAPDS